MPSAALVPSGKLITGAACAREVQSSGAAESRPPPIYAVGCYRSAARREAGAARRAREAGAAGAAPPCAAGVGTLPALHGCPLGRTVSGSWRSSDRLLYDRAGAAVVGGKAGEEVWCLARRQNTWCGGGGNGSHSSGPDGGTEGHTPV